MVIIIATMMIISSFRLVTVCDMIMMIKMMTMIMLIPAYLQMVLFC